MNRAGQTRAVAMPRVQLSDPRRFDDSEPRQLVHPIDLPGLAAVRRERLFVPARIRGGVEERELHENRVIVVRLLVVEFAATAGEGANVGHTEGALAAAREVEAPLARLGVVEAQ